MESGDKEKRSAVLIESNAEVSEKQSAVLIESAPVGEGLFPPLLGWTHYLILMRVNDPRARAFYGKLTHQDPGQIQMYVNYFDRFQRQEWEQPTVGIVLCSEKNDAMVKITLPEDNEQILAAGYQACLPTEEELRRELVTQRERIELARPPSCAWLFLATLM